MNNPKLPKLEYDFQKNFRKTFQGDEISWRHFVDNVQNGVPYEMYCANNSKKKERIIVDANVYATYSEDLDLLVKLLPKPYELHSEEHREELDFVRELSKKRDEKFQDQPERYPSGLKEVSYFLKDHNQTKFKKDVDYLTSVQELHNIYSGNLPTKKQVFEGTGNIATLRDGARFVRDDPAVQVWIDAFNLTASEGAKFRSEVFVRDYVEGSQHNFSVIGGIDIPYLYWKVAKRISRISFRLKHYFLFPRPEQAAWDLGEELISQAYDRGAPEGHGDLPAMHSAIYFSLKKLTLLLLDPLFLMRNGKTLEHNANVLAENGAFWRSIAGVHTMYANTALIPICDAIAMRVVNEEMEKTQSMVCSKRYK